VVLRIAVFFVGSIFLLAVILPWNSQEIGTSTYVSAFDKMGIPFAADIMNAVVLTAVLSRLNSGLYTTSRILFVLAGRHEAPRRLLEVNSRGVPVAAILLSTVVGFLCVIAAYVSPDTVFLFLLNSSGAVILFVYLLICISQYVLRRRTPDDQLRVKDVGLPGAHPADDRGDRGGADLDGRGHGHPLPAAAEPGVVGRGHRGVRRARPAPGPRRLRPDGRAD
jgi:GABA permease